MREEQPIRGIAFDLDGTLTDSAPGLTAALDRTLSERGTAPGRSGAHCHLDWQRRRCAGGARCATDAEPDAALQRATRLRFDEHYAATVASGSSLFPEVAETLTQLALQVLPMAVVTNKPPLCRTVAGLARHRAPFCADYRRR